MANENVIQFTSENFQNFISESDKPVLVDFWAPWCGPCRMLAPTIDELAEDYADKISVGKVNIDEEGDIAMEYRIMTIPTVILFKNGEIVEKNIGVAPKEELAQRIEKHL